MRPLPSRASVILIGLLVFSVGIGVPAILLYGPANAALFQCYDGIDNDGDARVDFPFDPGCLNYQDDSEADTSSTVGCIEILQETFDFNGSPLTPVAQFTFRLDGGGEARNDAAGRALFSNVSLGSHAISVVATTGWKPLSATPTNGVVQVTPGPICVTVAFKTQQERPPALYQDNPIYGVHQCNDGRDNDGDGWIDFPSDRGCTSRTDSSEYDYNDNYRYDDRYYRDNYYYDSRYSSDRYSYGSRYGNSHYNYGNRPACDDGIDNDRDGWADYPEDQNCSSYADNSEYGTSRGTNRECDDGIDNDRDGRRDYPSDTGCTSYSDDNESNTSSRYDDRSSYSYSSRYECDDGRDNDRDGWVDYPDDPSCSGYTDNNERNASSVNHRQCDDGIDNDRDGWYDYPEDPSCTSRSDTTENTYNDRFTDNYQDRYSYNYRDRYIDDRDYSYNDRECDDGRDNDGDGWYDYPEDPGCSGYTDDAEGSTRSQRPQCDDGKDNDGDGRRDYPSDRGCSSYTDRSEAESTRAQSWDDWTSWNDWNW